MWIFNKITKLFLEGGSHKSETLLTFLSSFIFDNWLVQKKRLSLTVKNNLVRMDT